MAHRPTLIQHHGQEPLVLTNWKFRTSNGGRRRALARHGTAPFWLAVAAFLQMVLLCRRG